MKRKFGFMALFLLFLIVFWSHPTFAAEDKKIGIGVNDLFINTKPDAQTMNNIAYSPVEPLFKGLRGQNIYTSASKTYSIHKNGKWMKVSVSDKTITTSNGSTIKNQVIIKNNVAYVPIRLVGEFFGFKVDYLPQYKIARIYNGNHKYSHQAFYYSNRKAIENYFHIDQGKIIYLTFDDGPNAYTSKVLDILKNKNAHGTFFMIEGNIRRYPQVAKRIIQEGNYPGLHSVSHDKNKLYMGKAQNVALEMEKTRKTLLSVTGFNSHMTRVPYGSKPYMSKSYRDYMAKYSFKMWDWSIDTEDWRYQKSNPRKIVSNVKSGIERLKNSKGPIVVLFHDTKGTVSVLPEIIDYLRQKGYQPAAYNPEQHTVVNFWKDSRL